MDDQRARLAKLQAQHDEIRAEIAALQRQLREVELAEQAEARLDALPEDERGVLIRAAAVRVGARPGR